MALALCQSHLASAESPASTQEKGARWREDRLGWKSRFGLGKVPRAGSQGPRGTQTHGDGDPGVPGTRNGPFGAEATDLQSAAQAPGLV